MTIEVLNLIKFMLLHGFYKNESDIESLVVLQIQILDGSCDIVSKEEEVEANENVERVQQKLNEDGIKKAGYRNMKRYEKNESNLIVMKCKQQVCEILMVISEIRMDLQVSKFLEKFKKRRIKKITKLQDLEEKAANQIKESEYQISNEGDQEVVPLNQPKIKNKKNNKIQISQSSSQFDSSLSKELNQFQETLKKVGKLIQPKEEIDENAQKIPKHLKYYYKIIQKLIGLESLDLQNQSKKNLVPIILDLSLYKHPELKQISFKLLYHYFNQRYQLLQSLQKIQLLEHNEAISTQEQSRQKLRQLREAVESSENWLGQNEKDLKQSIHANKHNNAIEALNYFISLCFRLGKKPINIEKQQAENNQETRDKEKLKDKSANSTEDSDDYLNSDNIRFDKAENNNTSEKQLQNQLKFCYDIFQENEIPNKENQRLLRNLNVHQLILKLIKIRPQKMFIRNENHKLILSLCFIFLAKFVRLERDNQNILFQHQDSFIEYFSWEVHAEQLIQELYRSNKNICYQLHTKGQHIIRALAKLIDETPLESSLKAQYLIPYRTFIKCKQNIIYQNQLLVCNSILSPAYDNIISQIRDNNTKAIEIFAQAIDQSEQAQKDCELVTPSEVQYLWVLFDLLTLCTEGKSGQAEQRVQSEISFKSCEDLLKLSGHI